MGVCGSNEALDEPYQKRITQSPHKQHNVMGTMKKGQTPELGNMNEIPDDIDQRFDEFCVRIYIYIYIYIMLHIIYIYIKCI